MNRPAPWQSLTAELLERRPFHVGAAVVDPLSREAKWPSGQERLQPQTLRVLVTLASRSGEVVTRDELIQLCWDGRIVGDDVINRSILLLRHFAERAGGFEIETVPRTGYRLVETHTTATPTRRRAIAMAGAGLIALAAVGLLIWSERQPGPAPPLTIALLPFGADGGDPAAEKAAKAAREALANTLAQGPYRVATLDAVPHGASPPADFVISAQFTGARDNIMGSLRMEETAHHVVVFSHQFETARSEADALPEIIGGQVASQVSWTAPMIAVERRHPSDPAIIASLLEASSAGLDGSGSLHDYEAARPLAEKDPDSPLAQLSFAMNTAFALDEIPRTQREEAIAAARAAADRALSLAPEFGDTYVPWCLLHSEQQMLPCEARLRAGMRADPDSPFANWFLVDIILNRVGRNAEGLELARASLAHDPYMPLKIALMLRMLEANGEREEADELYRQSQRWWPRNGIIDWSRSTGMLERGDFEAMKRFTDQVREPKDRDPVLLAIHRRSMPAIRLACSRAGGRDADICMLALAQFGDEDSAFAIGNRIFPSRRGRTDADEERIWLADPDANNTAFLAGAAAAALRRDPRFIPLAERVGLLTYWRSGRLPDFCRSHAEPICAQLRH